MSATWQSPRTAKIYQFPTGGRRTTQASAEAPKPTVLASSGWYHDVAMQAETERSN
jgi:hypothetical protein